MADAIAPLTDCVRDEAVARLFVLRNGDHRDLHSFPTRRSSDLASGHHLQPFLALLVLFQDPVVGCSQTCIQARSGQPTTDRKSTRLNSSHEWISYAVFSLKKKIAKPEQLSPVGKPSA